jgi:hypothetical protein
MKKGYIGLWRGLFNTIRLIVLILSAFFLVEQDIASSGNQKLWRQFCANEAMAGYRVIKKAFPGTQTVLLVLATIAVVLIASLSISEVSIRIRPPRSGGLKHSYN